MQLKFLGKNISIVEWNDHKLNPIVSLDTETKVIEHPSEIPPLVLTIAYDGGDKVYWIRENNLNKFLSNCQTIVMHTTSFDVSVIEKKECFSFHDKLTQDSLFDIALLYRLFHIATVGIEPRTWSLEFLAKEYLKIELEKKDEIRLSFGQYLNEDLSVNYDQISNEHLEYACLDAIVTRILFELLKKQFEKIPTSTYCAHTIQLMGDLALFRISKTGIGVDLPYVDYLKKDFQNKIKTYEEIMATYGVKKGAGFQTSYERAIKFLDIDLPSTDTHKLTSAEEHLEKYRDQPFINAYLEYKSYLKLESFLNELTSERVYPRYNSLKNSSRSSASKPNIQNMPRSGGIRECFIPDEGYVFLDIDYSAIELSAIASITKRLFHYSVMADKINEGVDLHIYAASKIFNIPEETVKKDQRQLAKALNFGLVANMAATTFCETAKTSYGLTINPSDAISLKKLWAKVFPEMQEYWKWGFGKTKVITHTGYVVNNCLYTQILNYPMQSLVAQGAKIALYYLIRNGFKVVAFVHDQVLIECIEKDAQIKLDEASKIMISAMEKVILGVKVKTEGSIKYKFTK